MNTKYLQTWRCECHPHKVRWNLGRQGVESFMQPVYNRVATLSDKSSFKKHGYYGDSPIPGVDRLLTFMYFHFNID